MPMAEFQFRLHVDPLLKWDSLNAQVRTYLEQQGDSIDIARIISRYTAAVLGQDLVRVVLDLALGAGAVFCWFLMTV